MDEKELKSIISHFGLVTELGLTVVICIMLGLGLGLLAAKWTNQNAIFKVSGVVLGLAAGIFQAYRIVVNKIK